MSLKNMEVYIERIKNFYKGKRVLLTGNTGFKGTWLNLMLNECEACVCGYALPVEERTFFYRVLPKTELQIEADISDFSRVKDVVSFFKPEIIIHLASYSMLRGSMEIPHYILKTNMMGVTNLLESVRDNNSVKSVVIVTSDKCYTIKNDNREYNEESELDANDPYGTSKVCQEFLTKCYKETFFDDIGVATARASNCIGPGDDNDTRLVPYLLKTFLDGGVPEIRHSSSIRSWQYVLDVNMGYMLLAKKLYEDCKYSGAYNFGPGKDGFVSVGNLVQKMAVFFGLEPGFSEDRVSDDPVRKETEVLKLDSSKSINILQWNRMIPFETALYLTANYIIESYKSNNDEHTLSREYVKKYFSCCQI